MKYIALFAALLIFSATVSAQENERAPNFTLKNSEGATLSLDTLDKDLVVVNFFTTWCGPCKAEIPGFLKVYDKYREKGLEIIGISLDHKGWKVLRPFMKKYKMSYPVVLDNGAVARKYGGVQAIPTTFFVDQKKNIARKHVGYLSAEQFEKIISEMI